MRLASNTAYIEISHYLSVLVTPLVYRNLLHGFSYDSYELVCQNLDHPKRNKNKYHQTNIDFLIEKSQILNSIP